MPLRTGGFYYRVMGRDFIAVDSRVAGVEKLLVLFHELGHFLLHTPESGATANFHGVGRKTRQEREADAFALCALIPKKRLTSRTAAELVDDGFPVEMVAERYAVYQRYGH
jgi:Zn-dependent peptidase ImmA (M78 family)